MGDVRKLIEAVGALIRAYIARHKAKRSLWRAILRAMEGRDW